ncbi:type 2 isopentenyl-diphosphate Delta-isomerase [bacterium]|nr:type 2 isopentenyl-diphosphate Delta-isomerase [bacterium]
MEIAKRKSEHFSIAVEKDVRFRKKSTGFEDYDLVHCALPEMNFDDVACETIFLSKKISFPLMISSMTGGYDGATTINGQLAEVCRSENIALGVGSQRPIIENNCFLESYRIARKINPDGIIIGNIGAVQVTETDDLSVFDRMVDLIEADGIAVHLNPLQEVLQPEGQAQFKGVLKGIEKMVNGLKVPVIVKEVGCGISEKVARKLVNAGVSYIDVAGAGGTSWAGIESFRVEKKSLVERFWDWGIPTARSVEMVSRVKGTRVIASGGIDNGVSMAKALAMGAVMCGAALPLLKVLIHQGIEGLVSLLQLWREELKMAMFLTGSLQIRDLRREGVIEKNRSSQ